MAVAFAVLPVGPSQTGSFVAQCFKSEKPDAFRSKAYAKLWKFARSVVHG